MVARTAQAGVQQVGGAATALFANSLPGGWIGFQQFTASNQGSIGTTETDLAGLSVTVTVGAGRRIQVEGYVPGAGTAAGDQVLVRIKEGSTELQANPQSVGQSSLSVRSFTGQPKTSLIVPAAGSHTYKLTMVRGNGSGSLSTIVSDSAPAWIAVYDWGPAS